MVSPDDPNLPKNIISAEQESWLQDQLLDSQARWRILGNQVVMSIWQLVDQLSGAITYANEDQWNGYLEGRGRLMRFLRDNDISNVVVVTGDVHSSWAMDVTVGDGSYDPETREGAVAVEFVAPGITSPLEISQQIVDAFTSQSPHIRYAEAMRKGYLVLDVQDDKVQSDLYLLDGIDGVTVNNAGNNTVGGLNTGEGNQISGNLKAGIALQQNAAVPMPGGYRMQMRVRMPTGETRSLGCTYSSQSRQVRLEVLTGS